jgi:2'-5' RNA ligase
MTPPRGRRSPRGARRNRGSGAEALKGEARLFLAIPVPPAVASRIESALSRGFPRGLPGRAVGPQGWHLTLRFLGATTAEAAARVSEAMRAVAEVPPFEVSLAGLAAFPDDERASVLWLGVGEGADEVRRLAAIAEEAATGAGFAPETRAFTPHLTLARLHPPEDVTDAVAGTLAVDARLPVTEVVLYRSHLRGGARYEAVERYPLASAEGPA